ncbi:hypothetical protein HMPREF0044_0393 [Gleimia coleocanis DSM 15436]|uniref:Uncharacterized protein n=1 Tax=Gleimia coleocanis DSM 15436 TaxID=525245 RepID=C0VZ03_9ACTO|nr:hypothetical protein HMPREF0044_0393 [Gleimia coleocanis DSM 15436]
MGAPVFFSEGGVWNALGKNRGGKCGLTNLPAEPPHIVKKRENL